MAPAGLSGSAASSRNEDEFRGRHCQLSRPRNYPVAVTRPHPPILIGGSGEQKTLRLVAQYAQACNLFPGPNLGHKLDVLRAHCEAVGRDYDEIDKTVLYQFDVGADGERVPQVLDEFAGFAELGFRTAIGGVRGVWTVRPLERIGSEVIPAVATL